MAERLTKAVTVGGAARRQKVKSLVITLDAEGSSRSKKLGALFKVCRGGIVALELFDLDGDFGGAGKTFLGAAAHEALRDLKQLECFRMTDCYAFGLTRNELVDMIMKWPRLRILDLPQMDIVELFPDRPLDCTGFFAITRLALHLSSDHQDILRYMLGSTKRFLRHLDLSRVFSDDDSASELTAEVMAPIIEVAPQLHSLRCESWWNPNEPYTLRDYLTPVLKALRDVRLLELGVHGFMLSEIPPILQPLKPLNYLSISEEEVEVLYQPFDKLTAEAVVHFLRSATSLRFLRLPHQLEYHYWDAGKIRDVRSIAKERFVDVKF